MFRVATQVVAVALLVSMPAALAAGGECRPGSADDRVVAHFLDAATDYVAFGRTKPLFTPEAAEFLRFQLRFTRWLQRYNAHETLGEPATVTAMPKENRGRLLGALPRLPEGLEYRLHGQHLLLVDRRTQMVVDVLEEAFGR